MSSGTELGAFLRSRRARLGPGEVGLASYGARRVPGLRREELARLAGVSLAYYTRLEQGQSANASDGVLDALARALRLSPDEHEHLRHLARPARGPARRQPVRPERARAGTRQLVAALGVPALALDRRYDVLAWNPLGRALLAGHLPADAPDRPADRLADRAAGRPNLQRMLFLDPHTRELYPHWDAEARRAVAALRLVSGELRDDRALAELIGELCVKSPEFAGLWARHPVGACTHGTKVLHHPEVGRLELAFEVLAAPDGSGHRLMLFSAEPGSPSDAALQLLGATLPAGSPLDAASGILDG
jgi:transcriptional regulator with XRE-family HTH domain